MQERQERRIRQIRRQVDWQWLNACLGMTTLLPSAGQNSCLNSN